MKCKKKPFFKGFKNKKEFAWVCYCGNTMDQEGFYGVDEFERLIQYHKAKLFCCTRCGEIEELNELIRIDIYENNLYKPVPLEQIRLFPSKGDYYEKGR